MPSAVNEQPDDRLHALQCGSINHAEAAVQPADAERFDLLAEDEREVAQFAFFTQPGTRQRARRTLPPQ